jgi:hypothetical protein
MASSVEPLLGVLSLAVEISLPRKIYRGSREHCAKCGGSIPPGKPGRMCFSCRSQKS